jgi:LacI family transcriptional regulator
VWLDNVSAAQASTEYLLQQGHRRIACVTADLPIDDRKQRLQGYRNAMAQAGIDVPGEWVISVSFDEEGGELAAEQILSSRHHFTAAVTFNDVMAAGMMRALHQRQIPLPEQLSIIGFDDVVLARYLYPALSTLHYPIERMAKRAAKLALLSQQQQGLPPQNNMFSAELVLRDSVIRWQG